MLQASKQPAHAKAAAAALSPDEWRSFKLVSQSYRWQHQAAVAASGAAHQAMRPSAQVHKEALTSGVASPTVLFRFALPSDDMEIGLPVASCLLTRAPIGSEKPDGSRAFVIRWAGWTVA